jgi:hypothetical protein
MARVKVRIYGVPDKHLYAPLPLRAWHALTVASWPLRAALIATGTATGLLLDLLRRVL